MHSNLNKRSYICLFVFFLLCLFFPPFLHAEGEVKINIVAVNPSPTTKLETTVRQLLPQEVKPEDVVEAAGMTIHYDAEQKTYYVTQKITLEPREAKTIVVMVRDVWVVPDEKVSKIKDQIEDSIKALQGTVYYDTAIMLRDRISAKLGDIEGAQAKAVGIKQKVDIYRANIKSLDAIEKEVFSLESLREIKEDQTAGMRTVKFSIDAENPSDAPKKMTIRAELPKDVAIENIVDKLDFVASFDAEKGRYVLEKRDEEFAPKEKRKYEITIRDIWFIPEADLKFMTQQTEKLMEHFKGTDYENYAQQISRFILDTLASIKQVQDEAEASGALEDRRRGYVLNSQRMELVKRKLKDWQDLLLELPLKVAKKNDAYQTLIKEIQKVQGVLMSKGIDPNRATTWWIILGIAIFVAVFAAVFYITWLSKLKESKWLKTSPQGKKEAKEGEVGSGAKKP